MTYKILLSNNATIPVDADEIQRVIANLPGKNFIKVRAGIFNPSFFVALTDDQERRIDYHENNKHKIRDGSMPKLPPPLKDIFAEVLDLKRLS